MSSKKYAKRELSLGKRIKELRKALNIKQIELARSLNISKGFMSEIERDVKTMGFEVLVRLKENYEINLHWFITGEGDMFGVPEVVEKGGLAEPSTHEWDSQWDKTMRNVDVQHLIRLIGKIPEEKQEEVLEALTRTVKLVVGGEG